MSQIVCTRSLASVGCLVLALAGCGERAAGPTVQPATADAPAAAAAPVAAAPAPAPAPVVAEALLPPVDEHVTADEAGWRVDFRLALPGLPATSSRRARRACEAWLFQGLVVPRGAFADSVAAAHQLLIADTPHEGAGDAWYAERAVVATRLGGGWLALSRSDNSYAGGAHPNSRIEGLVVQVDEVRALTLDEVVPLERQEALRRVLAGELRRIRGLPADGPLTSTIGSDAELPIPMPLIVDDGARFVWNAYEIAPYSDGAFEVRLPVAQMRAFLACDPW